jgi:hypothetical protein
MIVDTTADCPLGHAVRVAIRNTAEWRISADAEKLTSLLGGAGARAVIYSAADDLLQAQLSPEPAPQRLQALLEAVHALGAELFVAVVPTSVTYEPEEEAVRQANLPYVIVRCAPLVEEMAATDTTTSQTQRLESITTAELLSETVFRALQDPTWRNKTVEVPVLRRLPSRPAAEPRTSSFAEEVCGWLGLPRVPAFALEQASGGG